MASKTSSLWQALRAYQIYGANTDVGKTVMSTILCKALTSKKSSKNVWYLKPVSTGPLSEADNRHISQFSPETKTHCLYQFDEAVSPHIAARSKPPLSDSEILESILQHLKSCAEAASGVMLLETAGGVHSPTPSGTSQADLYRPLRLPICLVADQKLGGISASISAFESLHVRGYDLDAVLQFEESQYQNHVYLREYFEKKGIKTIALPAPPKRASSESDDREMMAEYYETMSKHDAVEELLRNLVQKHDKRINDLESMAKRAYKQIWYPFTQHKDISEETILTVDSAYGDFFQTKVREDSQSILTPTFDGSASWWTQGLGHGNPELSLAAAYAAGRYGHVMFAGAINEPSLLLAESMLKNMGNPRLQKVFFSDNGSTGMEVAVKMALAASAKRYKWKKAAKDEVGIIGLKGSYHGDTIGTMDCSEPGVYNEKVHWYQGRGYWFDFPQVMLKKGTWVVECPANIQEWCGEGENFETLNDVFDIEARLKSNTAAWYRDYITVTLKRLVLKESKVFGALILEPVILGAGGMLFADPLFQHLLVTTVRESQFAYGSPISPKPDPTWNGLPVIFDEVFTGLYRLGRFSSASFLQVQPDISCHAKLLTGGLVPLCTTLASDSIYQAFLSSKKADALLHGHSYTAHAVGCHVANTSLNAMMDMDQSGQWQAYKDDWSLPSPDVTATETSTQKTSQLPVWSAWSKEFTHKISFSKDVESVVALGSVLAIALQDEEAAGYSSSAATGLRTRLLEGSTQFNVHSRVLGNVFYLMASQTSKPETLKEIERILGEALL